MTFQETKDYLTNNGIEEIDLDGLVDMVKSREASDINNNGFDAQLSYLLGKGYAPEFIKEHLK